MRPVVPLLLASILALSACGGSTNTSSNPGSSTVTDAAASTTADATSSGDAAVGTDVAAPGTDAAAACTYPPGPYGSRMGAIFQPFTLAACDGSNWSFDQEGFCAANLTVISIAAGWCVPCQMESAQMQAVIADHYAGMGVRVVQILVQNPDHSEITGAFCSEWASRYGLMFPELIDPLMMTSVYTPNQAFPGNIIVDRQGRIRFREYGETTGLTTLTAAIDDVLANPNP